MEMRDSAMRRVRSSGDAGGGSDCDGHYRRWLSPMRLLCFKHSTGGKEDDATTAPTMPSVMASDVNGHSGDERLCRWRTWYVQWL